MKKLGSFLLALFLTFSLTACADKNDGGKKLKEIKEKGVITVATSPDFGPYEFMDLSKEGEEAIVGCDVSLAKYIANELGVTLKIEPMDFDSCQAAVSVGKVDFSISGYAKTPEREESMECSNLFQWSKPDEKSQGILILKDKENTYNSKESFLDKTVGAQNASLQMNLVQDQLPNSKVETISSINDGVMMLLNGKIDALASSYDTGLQFCKNYPQLTMSEFVFIDTLEDGNVALAPKGEKALIEEINKAIEKAKNEGMFEKWLSEATDLCDTLGIEVN